MIDSGEGTTAGSVTYVYYGLASGVAQMTGTYTGSIKFTATANSTTEPNLDEMQDYNCSKLEVGETVYLIDNRDHNKYLVGKLEDKQCWMLQNLRLISTDPDDPIVLTSEDSNIGTYTKEFKVPVSSGGSSNKAWADDYNNPYAHVADGTETG